MTWQTDLLFVVGALQLFGGLAPTGSVSSIGIYSVLMLQFTPKTNQLALTVQQGRDEQECIEKQEAQRETEGEKSC